MKLFMYNRTFTRSILLFLIFCALFCSRCESRAIQDSTGDLTLQESSGRFIYWEKCSDEWNDDKNTTEVCCKGNYKCSSDKCKDNGLCKISFLSTKLWCHHNSCKKKDDKKKDKDNDKKKDDKKKDKDDKKKDDKKKDKDDKKKDDKKKYKDDKKKDDKKKDDGKDDKKYSPSPTPSSTPSPVPSASPSPGPVTFYPLNCDGRRERREIRDLSWEDRRRWRNAITRMRADRDSQGFSEWDRLAQLHMNNADEAHDGSYFLPWHSLFLLRLENALRRYEPDLALPYWDWSIDAADAATSRVWDADYAGGAIRGPAPIQSGDFRNIEGLVPNQHLVQRNFNSGTSGDMPAFWGWSTLDIILNEPNFGDFSDGIESAHSFPHVAVGGDMRNTWSAPNDPIFYLHHAFTDRLYAIRKSRFGNNNFGGTHDYNWGSENVNADKSFTAFGVSPRYAFNLNCVHYVNPRLQGRSIPRKESGNRPDVCSSVKGSHGMSESRCRRGQKRLVAAESNE